MSELACLTNPLSKMKTTSALSRPVLDLNMSSLCPDKQLIDILSFSSTFLLIPSLFLSVCECRNYTQNPSSGSSYFFTF